MKEGEARRRSTILYIVITVALLLIGIVLLLWGKIVSNGSVKTDTVLVAVGTSLLASGITSLGLGILRKFDDQDHEDQDHLLKSIDAAVSGPNLTVLQAVTIETQEIRRRTLSNSSAKLRCISDNQVGSRFQREYELVRASAEAQRSVRVDVLGLKLHRFLNDQYFWLRNMNEKVHLKLLLQDPDGDVFRDICQLEGRSEDAARRDLAKSLKLLSPGAEKVGRSLVRLDGNMRTEVRFTSSYQPVTLFRIDGVICVRPRVLTPNGAATRFYEFYYESDSADHFRVQKGHFDASWSDAQYHIPKSLASYLGTATNDVIG